MTRSWYSQVRSVFGKPRLMQVSEVQDPSSISHPSQPVGALLGTIPSLRFATPARLRALAEATHREAVAAGQTITEQGEEGDDVFFVIDGTYEVLISHFGHTPDFIREMHAGESFGELGVLYNVPRTATVRCTTAGHILRIPGETFLDTLETGS
jgi:CRP-like cAMP-binding protein